MSLTYTVDVWCDHEEGSDGATCIEWVHGMVGGRPNLAEARSRARAAGWVRRNGRDYCPTHAPLHKRATV